MITGSHPQTKETNAKFQQLTDRLAEMGIANNLTTLLPMQASLLTDISALQKGQESRLEALAKQHVLALFGLEEGEISLRPRLMLRAEIAEGTPEVAVGPQIINYAKLQEIQELSKRQRMNALIHGAASVVQEYFHLLKDELDTTSPELFLASKKFLAVSEAIFLLHSGQGELLRDESSYAGITFLSHNPQAASGLQIEARAVCFPILLHECAKGICEQLAVYGLPADQDLARRVMNTADRPGYEADMILIGYESWLNLCKTLGFSGDFEGNRSRTKFLIDFFRLPVEQFLLEYKQLTVGTMTEWAQCWLAKQ